MANLIEGDLSYKIVGILFDVYNNLGGGYQEKYYQRAISQAFKKENIQFKEQINVPLEFNGYSIGRYFLDFLIEEKIILEIKCNSRIYNRDVKQILSYLKSANIDLGILVNFSKDKLQTKRILKGLKH